MLSHTIGRIESIWKPVTATESFEIVRRRLFAGEVDFAARDAVLSAYQRMYAEGSGDYPNGVAGAVFPATARGLPHPPGAVRPSVPGLVDAGALQRTRRAAPDGGGDPRAVVSGDQSLLIMPCSIPLDVANRRAAEMLRYLPENWSAIVDTDIDGGESHPFVIDKGVPTLGQYGACRRVAHDLCGRRAVSGGHGGSRVEECINLGGAAGRAAGRVRGCAAPAEQPVDVSLFGRHRYWYDTQPTVNRLALDRARASRRSG